ncbi:MAG: glycine cleavage system protein H [Burkholderiales bacterium]|nr:glycine cleavage system protein H [Burkholderiales bacterium]
MKPMHIGTLQFPDDLFYLVEHQVWARVSADHGVTVGITALGIRVAGEIYMCRPKPVGAVLEQGKSVAVVELAKSIVSVKSPVSGTVLETNTQLATAPELVHLDPYGQGWIARLQADQLEGDLGHLLQGKAVKPAMEHYARLYQVEQA